MAAMPLAAGNAGARAEGLDDGAGDGWDGDGDMIALEDAAEARASDSATLPLLCLMQDFPMQLLPCNIALEV